MSVTRAGKRLGVDRGGGYLHGVASVHRVRPIKRSQCVQLRTTGSLHPPILEVTAEGAVAHPHLTVGCVQEGKGERVVHHGGNEDGGGGGGGGGTGLAVTVSGAFVHSGSLAGGHVVPEPLGVQDGHPGHQQPALLWVSSLGVVIGSGKRGVDSTSCHDQLVITNVGR